MPLFSVTEISMVIAAVILALFSPIFIVGVGGLVLIGIYRYFRRAAIEKERAQLRRHIQNLERSSSSHNPQWN